MKDQHRHIKGYRDLSQAEGLDQRWVSVGCTDLQTGFMALVRGVAQPTTF